MAELETEGFGIYFKPEFWAALDDNKKEQLQVYMEAYETFVQRELKYHSLWKRYGATDSYHHVVSKAARAQFYLEGAEDESDPIDLINYTAFLIRNVRAGRLTNTVRMEEMLVIAIADEDIKAGDQVVINLVNGRLARCSTSKTPATDG